MFVIIVTDDQLLTSQIVKTILLVILVIGIGFNVVRLIQKSTLQQKLINLVILICLIGVTSIVFKTYQLDADLLDNPKYIYGRTIGYCDVFAEGQGIEFEYEVEGIKYHNCNTFHPIAKDSIKVPGGEYKVRYTQKYKDKGRMVFSKE